MEVSSVHNQMNVRVFIYVLVQLDDSFPHYGCRGKHRHQDSLDTCTHDSTLRMSVQARLSSTTSFVRRSSSTTVALLSFDFTLWTLTCVFPSILVYHSPSRTKYTSTATRKTTCLLTSRVTAGFLAELCLQLVSV